MIPMPAILLKPVHQDTLSQRYPNHGTIQGLIEKRRVMGTGFEGFRGEGGAGRRIEEHGIDQSAFRDGRHRQAEQPARGCGETLYQNLPR